jgi:regulator of protease activity HflC (stomatin/prohibitin superfamily)
MNKVYATYAQPVIREAVRSVITQYNIEQIMENRDAVSQKLTQIVREKLKSTPIQIIRFGLANVQPPQVIVDAQEAAKKREIDIQQAEADKLVKIKEAEGRLEIAKKQQQVDLYEAETQVLVQKKLDKGVTPAYIAQRGLKALELLAQSNNKVILLPTEALTNPAIMVGVMQEAGKDGSPVVNLTRGDK